LFLLVSSALADSVIYPVPGHLDAAEGTIEYWQRLDVVPEPGGYFIFFQIMKPGESNPRIRFSYQTIWTTNHFHFFFSSLGLINGTFAANPYVVTAEDTAGPLKGESGTNRFPRIPRLKAGDWHHVAITWKGLPQSTVSMYFDGRVVIPPVPLHAPLWEGMDQFVLQLESNPYRDAHTLDELRISSVARSQDEIEHSFAAVRARADRNTLLLDHFEEIRQASGKWQTVPEMFTFGYEPPGGLINRANMVELVEGRSGKGMRFLRHYK
jgi:hypothetical protein